MKPLLSITIPTYNRHECLARTLSVLKPQLRDEVEIVVVDNNSSPSARITVDDIFPQPTNNVRVICNDVNIGLCANILRCFEVASSDRIWVLSDDDSVDALAINTILAHPQESLVDIYSISSRTPLPNIVVDSLTQLLVLLDSWPHLMFISSSVYDRKTLLPYIRHAYNFIGCGAPHIALLLFADSDQDMNKFALHSEIIADWKAPSLQRRYSQFTCIGWAQILSIPHPHAQRLLKPLLLACLPAARSLLAHILRDAAMGRDRNVLRNVFTHYVHAVSLTSPSQFKPITAALLLRILPLLLLRPALLYNIVVRLRRNKLNMEHVNVQFDCYDSDD